MLLLSAGLLGCGVPLPAADLTATAVIESANRQAAGAATEASSRAASTILLDPQSTAGSSPAPGALATIAPLGTIALTPAAGTPTPVAATPTPAASRTPGASGTGTPAVAGTGTPPATTATPARTGTPPVTGSATPAASTTPTAISGAQLTSQLVTASPSSSGSAGSGPASEAVAAVNNIRTSSGRPALSVSPQLSAAANAYAKLMADRNYFGHTGPDGSVAEGRIRAAGYAGRFKGEALAAGQTTAAGVLSTWLTSPGHASIVLDSSAVEVGIGYYSAPGTTYNHYWVLVTGNP